MSDLIESAATLRMLNGKLSRRLRESSLPGELSWSQLSVLGYLVREGEMTITQLAAAEGVRSQSMGATVASLHEKKLIVGKADPADGRKTCYGATPAGIAQVTLNRAQRDDWLVQAIDSRLTADEQQLLLRALPLLQRLADTPP